MNRRVPLRAAASVFLAFALAFSGCLQGSEPPGDPDSKATPKRIVPPARDPASPLFKPHVVVAVIDTGVNVYHSEFREGYDDADPASYIPGYPKDVPPLRLSPFSEPVQGAVNRDKADQEVWSATTPRNLYRVEGTKIVGLISFGGNLPGSGHGTMTSSRATGNTISSGGPAIRLVHVVGFNAEAIQWAGEQDWIDILSISSGVSAGVLAPAAANAIDGPTMKIMNAAAQKKPFFASSGNGATNFGLVGFPTWLRGPSGVPDVISVGANDNGRLALWHNQHPYIVGDGCQNPSASDNTADRVAPTGGGTSSATPFSAGTGAAFLLEARRILGDTHVGPRTSDQAVASFSRWSSGNPGDARVILAQGPAGLVKEGPLADGVLTLQEFKDVLFHTAKWDGSEEASDGNACVGPYMGTTPPGSLDRNVVAQFQGYGEVNGKTLQEAIKVLRGESPNPSRPQDDAWYERFYALRQATMPRT